MQVLNLDSKNFFIKLNTRKAHTRSLRTTMAKIMAQTTHPQILNYKFFFIEYITGKEHEIAKQIGFVMLKIFDIVEAALTVQSPVYIQGVLSTKHSKSNPRQNTQMKSLREA